MRFQIKNPRVVIFALLAIGCIVLTFAVHEAFLIGAVILMLINQKLLMKKKE